MWRVAVEGFNIEDTKCLVDIVGIHRCPSRVTHEPGSFLVFVSMAITPGLSGMFATPTSTTWCILYSTSLARAEATASGRPVMFRDSAISCGVHDQHGLARQYESNDYTNRLRFVNTCSLAG